MKSKAELEALLILVRIFGGEPDVLDHMNIEERRNALNSVMMAKRMKPSKEEWEQLGFTFTDIPDDDILCRATLPKGWTLEETDHCLWTDIKDENGRIRGSMYYNSLPYDRSARMSLRCRYGVHVGSVVEDSFVEEIYFGNEQEKLFVAGQIRRARGQISREEADARFDREDALRKMAEEFGDANYPGWKSVHSYWGIGKDVIEEKPKEYVYKKS